MKKILSIAIVGVVSLALCTGVMAQDDAKKDTKTTKATKTTVKTETKTEKKAEAKPVAAKKQQFTGIVTAVDAAANTLTVEKQAKKGNESMTFTAGAKVKLADIKKDSKVTVIYTKDGDKAEAVSVKESKAAAKAEKKAEKVEKKTTKTTEKKTEKEETK